MVTVKLLCGTDKRAKLKLPADQSSVSTLTLARLKAVAAEQTTLPETELVPTFGGRPLVVASEQRPDGKELTLADAYPTIDDNATLFVFRRGSNPQQQTSPTTLPAVSQNQIDSVVAAFAATFSDRAQRALLRRIASGPDTIRNLIASGTVPGLDEDLVAQAVLKDYYLLAHWLNDRNATQTLTKHPALVEGTQALIGILHDEVVKQQTSGNGSGAPLAGVLGLPGPHDIFMEPENDNTEDDDDDENADSSGAGAGAAFPPGALRTPIRPYGNPGMGSGGGPTAAGSSGGGSLQIPQFTVENLAQAIASATGGPTASATTPIPSSSPGSGRSSGRAPDPVGSGTSAATPITASLFQDALSQALGISPSAAGAGSGGATGSGSIGSTGISAEALAQLSDMGFIDDDENRRALATTGGNVELALEWIINQREANDG